MADAMRRGALCTDRMTGSDSIGYLLMDCFELSPLTLEEVQERFRVTAESAAALSAGSVGPWEPGGISPFQYQSGQTIADKEEREYDAYGPKWRWLEGAV
jgi:hypothetical protein